MSNSPFIEVKNIRKAFGDIIANDNVDLDLYRGELHALVGENGAGKTTLMRILMGIYKPDEGEIRVEGSPIGSFKPKDAIMRGIMMVSQHSSLVGSFNAIENLLITESFSRNLLPSFVKAEETLLKWEKELEYKLDLQSIVDFLPYAERQKIEVVRALCSNLKILILDEPTSMLPPQYASILYEHLRRLLSEGIGVFYTTHKLSEAMDFSDRITVLRQGRVIFTKSTAKITRGELIKGMVGEELDLAVQRPRIDFGDTISGIKNLSVKDDKEKTRLIDFHLDIRRGEIVGIAGTPKSGKLELVEALLGLRKKINGSIEIDGINIENLDTRKIIAAGVGYVPEGAKFVALVDEFTVAENSILTEHDQKPFSKKNLIDFQRVRDHATKCVQEFDVRTESIDTPAWCLSGGNAQKLVIAREFLRKNLRLLVLVNPTAGLDIRTTKSVWEKTLQMKEKGIGILLVSEELNELKQLSDSIIVLHEGETVGVFPSTEISIEDMGLMMLGVNSED